MAIRNRGTLGGSLAYADPAAELPACAVALDATVVLRSLAGEREVQAEEFFKGLFETDLRPGELIVAVKFPATPAGMSVGFAELSRRHGDFALVGLAATVVMPARSDREGAPRLFRLRRPRQGCPVDVAGDRRSGRAVAGYARRSRDAIHDDLSPDDTPGLRADTRLHMAQVLTRRVLNSLVGEDGRMTGLIGDEEVEIEATLNGKPLKRRVKARHASGRLPAPGARADRNASWLRARHLRRLHGSARRSYGARLPDLGRPDFRQIRDDDRRSQRKRRRWRRCKGNSSTRNAAQCGFCSSGMLLTAYELLSSGEKLSRVQIREAISGNMCRCTGYHAIVDAIEAASAKRQNGTSHVR